MHRIHWFETVEDEKISIIAATGRVFEARIVTGDPHFEKIENVEMVE